jgi:hypothetical protein
LDEYLSLAIGRSGQNARIAAKVTGWRVDIQGATEAAVWALEQVNETPELLDALKSTASLIPRLASIMRTHEEGHYPYTDEERSTIGAVVGAVRSAIIAHRDAQRPGSEQAQARQLAQRRVEEDRVKAREDAQARVPRGAYKVPLVDLPVADKVRSNLLTNGLQNVGEVMERMALGDEALLMLRGVGVKALGDIKQAVEASGLSLLKLGEVELEEAEEAPAADEGAPVAEVEAEAEQVSVATEEPSEEPAPELVEELAVEDVEEPEEPEAEAVEAPAEAEAEPAAMAEELTETPEAEPEAEETAEAEEPILAEDIVSPELSEYVDELAEEIEEIEKPEVEDLIPEGQKRKGRKRRRRTVIYDEELGEAFVVRRRRSGNADEWGEYGDDY